MRSGARDLKSQGKNTPFLGYELAGPRALHASSTATWCYEAMKRAALLVRSRCSPRCSSTNKGGYYKDDGPDANPPGNLASRSRRACRAPSR